MFYSPLPSIFTTYSPRTAAKMGLVETLLGPLAENLPSTSIWATIALCFAAFFILAIVLNVLQQLLFKKPNEPPIVFHWVPIIGSTITYGIDPYQFFGACRRKVHSLHDISKCAANVSSTATSSPSSYLEKRRLYAWEQKATISSSMESTRT